MNLKAIQNLLTLLKYYPWAIPVIIFLGILSSLVEGLGLSLFIPFLQMQVASESATETPLISFLSQLLAFIPASQRLLIIPLCIFASILLKNCLTYSNWLVFAWLNSRISHQLRSKVFNQLLFVSYEYLERKNSGRLLNILATETWRTSDALKIVVNLIISACTITVFVCLLLLLSWQLTLLVGVCMVLISVGTQFLNRRAKRAGHLAVQMNAELGSRMYEGLAGIRTIRAFGQERYEQQRFDRVSKQVRNTFMTLDSLYGAVPPLYEVFSALLVLGILTIALLQYQTALPTLLTFLFILYRLQPQMQQFDSSRVALMALTSSVNEVMDFVNTADKPYIRSGRRPFTGLQRSLFLNSVSFRYRPDEPPALDNITLSIPRGHTTALVGPSGAGKSTLIRLLCRFYEVSDGEIYVDDVPLRQLNIADWRSRLAIVSQDVYIFSTSIEENIAYGCPTATPADVVAAAQLANAHDFITQLPQGYKTQVGDRGIRLSGGQRQRLALARAIVRRPDILILDEATNALDTIAEHLIQEALDTFSQNRTVIVIAHRLSTILRADQIVVLDNGRMVECGNLAHLLQKDGLFAELYRLQYHSLKS